jgi:AcrR family transcriptional regulator
LSQEGAAAPVEDVGIDYGIDPAQQLPRGRNALPRQFVLSHQRERLLVAATEALDQVGYPALTIEKVIKRARVSRKSFYDIFSGKYECVRAAYDAAFDQLFAAIGDACREHREWPQGVMAAVGAALDFAAADPTRARLLLVHTLSAEPRLAEHALDSQQRLAGLLREGRRFTPPGAPPLEVTELALIGASTAVLAAVLMAEGPGQPGGLGELKPELGQILLTPYLGPEAARDFALGDGNGSARHRDAPEK